MGVDELRQKLAAKWEKYRNPDPRCGYPWTPDFCGYCWSYASHVDGVPRFSDIETICSGRDGSKAACEFWHASSHTVREGGSDG